LKNSSILYNSIEITSKLKYPVFAFQKNDSMIYVFFEDKDLKSTSVQFLNQNGFVGDTLIDLKGNIFKIKKAFKVKYIGLLGFSLLKKGRQILVDFEFDSEIKTISLSEFKKDIIERIKINKSYWEASWNIEDLIENINNSTSFESIAQFLK